ncbi:DNA repair protein RecN (Recombination protein N) [Nocardioides luteus]|uniref:DNA repair protein RecN n=1 Tax=Nocardioides luteus TaxID=1844 RepID=A0ABQ5T1T6_9ACTN|nr:DNA repair protein RecN [Nocardioides luteus]MDR7310447.1 DNA repair protein RecN (Recombination protein N) [Nocardioides luteus]GGR52655.1 DNA repair protein RecN [Nocardioides luteus]GLJ69773.1 DNA repair protein RecN [Nocardioides luteus]
MLEEIRISGLGIIESSTLELGPGLTVVTGETGAGKTMIVTALGLLLGGRGDAGSVRKGKKAARVEGVIDARSLPGVVDATEEAGGEVEEGRVLVARTVAAEGRARAYVGGATVPVATLGSVTSPLVAVHGQSDQHRLLQPRAQRDSLDRFGGETVAELIAAYADIHAELRRVESELDEVTTHARERAQEADLLRFGLGEVEAVSPESGEDVTLAQEEEKLGYADTLRTAAEQAREALSSEVDAPDAMGAISAARQALDGVRDHDPDAASLADRLAEVAYLLSDLSADVASYATAIETDPARLAAVSERRAALTALTRKYGETIDEVLAWAETGAKRLLELDSDDDRIAELRSERTRLRSALAEAGLALSEARTKAAGVLSEAVSDELTGLAMPHARLVVDVRQKETEAPASEEEPHAPLKVGSGKATRWLRYGSNGLDEVELLLAANTGSEPRPLHKGASGGELSRVMLAIEVVLAATSPVPTFVFDEVDAGVGGTAAVEIGRRLAQLARTAQVLVVTHLPQVAAFADHHVAVEKTSDGVVTSSGLSVLDDESRERELSRMLAGLTASDTAIAHARELLEVARSAKA